MREKETPGVVSPVSLVWFGLSYPMLTGIVFLVLCFCFGACTMPCSGRQGPHDRVMRFTTVLLHRFVGVILFYEHRTSPPIRASSVISHDSQILPTRVL